LFFTETYRGRDGHRLRASNNDLTSPYLEHSLLPNYYPTPSEYLLLKGMFYKADYIYFAFLDVPLTIFWLINFLGCYLLNYYGWTIHYDVGLIS
jgi:hypothetical protein